MTMTIETKLAGVKKLTHDGAGQARVMLDQATANATRTTEGLMKAAEEAMEFGRANLDALSRATQACGTGLQELGRQSVSALQGFTEQGFDAAKAIVAAKSLKEAAELQTGYVRASLDRLLAEQTKLQDVVLKTAEAAMAPLTARATAAAERAARPLAA